MNVKKIFKKTVSAVLAAVMMCGLFGGLPKFLSETAAPMKVEASTNGHSADDAIAWCKAQVGKYLYNGQCVGFIVEYYKYLGQAMVYGNAKDYATNSLPSGWQRIAGATPQKGDVLVYTDGQYGHVAIYESESMTYHQNYNYVQYVQAIPSSQWYWKRSGYWGVIRPDFTTPSTVTPAKPAPVTAKEGYASMSTIFSWNACSNATSYDLRIYTSSSLSSESRIDNFGSLIKVKDTSYSVSLPQGDYWITIASVNDTSGKYQFADNATKFTVKAPDYYLPRAVEKYNDHIYAFYDYAAYYEQAEKISEQLGGHLVTISNKKENEAVANLIGKNKKSWMGLIRNKSGEFEWTDGTTSSYTNWSEGEPNNDGGAENYGVIYSGGTWNDSYTGMYTTGYFYGFSGFIVEYEPSDIKPTTTVVYNGHQYEYYNIPVGYDIANEICEKAGGHIVTISDKKENDTMAKLIGKNQKSWLGLIRNKNGDFEWIDETELSYTNWSKNEPNNDGGVENYGVIYASGEWNDSYTGKFPTGDYYAYCGFVLEKNNILGDINNDKKFNVSDAVLLKKHLLGIKKLVISTPDSADMNSDGKINVFDLIIMKRLLVSK